jgi:hypothetical protein
MADNPPDPPLPASVADILKQLTALANPQNSTAYNPGSNAVAPEPYVGRFSETDRQAPWQSESNLTLDQCFQGYTPVSNIVNSDRKAASSSSLDLHSQPKLKPGDTDYLSQLRQITANALSQPKKDVGAQPRVNSESNVHASQNSQSFGSPSTILEWAPALRHVSRIGTNNPEFQIAIQKVMLISNQ